MQMRFATDLSADEYVRQKAWKHARLDNCPLHPKGGCGFAKHGTYTRKFPDGTKIPRWYCLDGHTTFSLLPDCLASRLSGSLTEVEAVIAKVESSPSQEAAAHHLRPYIELPGILRWIRRRTFLVKAALIMLIELFPSLLAGCTSTISSFRSVLGVEHVLPELRMLGSLHLDILPPPLGFGPRPGLQKIKKSHFQHKTGTDPPPKNW
jgi:hypothetical protein